MKNITLLLTMVSVFSLQCSTPRNTQYTPQPSAPYLNADGSYSQTLEYGVEPSAPEEPVYVTMIVDMHGFKQKIAYDCNRDIERFHADVEMIVQQVYEILQSRFLDDTRPRLREQMLQTLYQNLDGQEYTLKVIINDQECSVLKWPSSGTFNDYYLIHYLYDTQPAVAIPNIVEKDTQQGLYARFCVGLARIYNTIIN